MTQRELMMAFVALGIDCRYHVNDDCRSGKVVTTRGVVVTLGTSVRVVMESDQRTPSAVAAELRKEMRATAKAERAARRAAAHRIAYDEEQ